jgi:hypothetical protein
MRLSLWQRLGIVLSVVWIIGSFAYCLHRDMSHRSGAAEAVFGLCMTGPSPRLNECQSRYEKTKADYARIPFYWPNPLILGFGPLPFFWLGGWIFLALTRWVMRGSGQKVST